MHDMLLFIIFNLHLFQFFALVFVFDQLSESVSIVIETSCYFTTLVNISDVANSYINISLKSVLVMTIFGIAQKFLDL